MSRESDLMLLTYLLRDIFDDEEIIICLGRTNMARLKSLIPIPPENTGVPEIRFNGIKFERIKS